MVQKGYLKHFTLAFIIIINAMWEIKLQKLFNH